MDGCSQGTRLIRLYRHHLIDLKVAIIVDVEATRAVRHAEVGAARMMTDRTETPRTAPRSVWLPTALMNQPTC